MIKQKLVCKHPLGGIKVNYQTLQTYKPTGNPNNKIFAVGEVTRGDCLTTHNNMAQVTNQAKRVSHVLIQHLRGIKNLRKKIGISTAASSVRLFGTVARATRNHFNLDFPLVCFLLLRENS